MGAVYFALNVWNTTDFWKEKLKYYVNYGVLIEKNIKISNNLFYSFFI